MSSEPEQKENSGVRQTQALIEIGRAYRWRVFVQCSAMLVATPSIMLIAHRPSRIVMAAVVTATWLMVSYKNWSWFRHELRNFERSREHLQREGRDHKL